MVFGGFASMYFLVLLLTHIGEIPGGHAKAFCAPVIAMSIPHLSMCSSSPPTIDTPSST